MTLFATDEETTKRAGVADSETRLIVAAPEELTGCEGGEVRCVSCQPGLEERA